ncbi:hypothetical protein SAMN04488528_101543 [Clostridium frigidicarnis]|uniref:Uncharacterized protein n=1 Tax=Clostridium frigidicarnis TaxID=84698 RepID=A0A1I0YV02_9CLOT|nr:hypothetical protein SAMN04488528_101543 [Clostridium frigidicarnis]
MVIESYDRAVIGAVMALLFFEFDLNHIFINQS